MPLYMTPSILIEIERAVKRAENDGGILSVYAVAKWVQALHPEDNVALEDVITALVKRAKHTCLGLLFDPSVLAYVDIWMDHEAESDGSMAALLRERHATTWH